MAYVPTIFYIAPSYGSVKETHYFGDTNHRFYPGGVEEFIATNGAKGYQFFDSRKARGVVAARLTHTGFRIRK